jgi:hypothetical protein
MPDIIATVNTSDRVTTIVRLTTAIICPITALIGPARATIGRITATATIRIIGDRGSSSNVSWTSSFSAETTRGEGIAMRQEFRDRRDFEFGRHLVETGRDMRIDLYD